MTDPDLLAEWAERVVDAEEDRLLAAHIGDVYGQLSHLADRAAAILTLRRSKGRDLGVQARETLAWVSDEINRLGAILDAAR